MFFIPKLFLKTLHSAYAGEFTRKG